MGKPWFKTKFTLAFVIAILLMPWAALAQRAMPPARREPCGPAPVNFVDVSGKGLKHSSLLLEGLEKHELDRTDQSGIPQRFEGVLLADVLRKAGLPETKTPEVEPDVKVIGKDCSFMVISLNEALHSPDILLADSLNGKPLPSSQGPLLLVIGKDNDRSRFVRGVSYFEVRVGKRHQK
jgi:hypothetical protein